MVIPLSMLNVTVHTGQRFPVTIGPRVDYSKESFANWLELKIRKQFPDTVILTINV